MKKVYGKPEISFEDFAFSNNIAGGCGTVSTQGMKDSCTRYGNYSSPETGCEFIDNGYTFFNASGHDCLFTPQDEDPNGLCYHTSSVENRMFNS